MTTIAQDAKHNVDGTALREAEIYLRRASFCCLAVATVWFTLACSPWRPFSLNPASDDTLTGTWTARAVGFTFILTLPTAACGFGCGMRAPGTYAQDATGARGHFAVNVDMQRPPTSARILMNFLSDTSLDAVSYQEQFNGRLVSPTRIEGVITLFPDHPVSPFHLADGTALSFVRQ